MEIEIAMDSVPLLPPLPVVGLGLEGLEGMEVELDVDTEDELRMGDEMGTIAQETWLDANDEVDAAMMESDSEWDDDEVDDGYEGTDVGGSRCVALLLYLLSPVVSDFLDVVPRVHHNKNRRPSSQLRGSSLSVTRGVKRMRSTTPSPIPSPLKNQKVLLTEEDLNDPNLRSPLAKRKKLADRRGGSSLRQSTTGVGGESRGVTPGAVDEGRGPVPPSPSPSPLVDKGKGKEKDKEKLPEPEQERGS